MDQLKVFISYRRADTQHVAGRLGDRVGGRFRLFMDIDDIPLGRDFAAVVHRAVDESDVLLVLIGREFLAVDADGHSRLDTPGDWVATEVVAGLDRGIPVIPILVDGAQMPTQASLPESVQPLVRRQAFRLAHASFNDDADTLIRALVAIQRSQAEDEPDQPARLLATPIVSWAALVAVIVVIVVEQQLLTLYGVVGVPQVVLALLPVVTATVLTGRDTQRLSPEAGRRLQTNSLLGTGLGILTLLLSLAVQAQWDAHLIDNHRVAVVALLALPFTASLVTYLVLRRRLGLLALWPALFVVVAPCGMGAIVGLALS